LTIAYRITESTSITSDSSSKTAAMPAGADARLALCPSLGNQLTEGRTPKTINYDHVDFAT